MLDFLQNVSFWFDEFVFVFDSSQPDASDQIVEEYGRRQLEVNAGFDENKYRVFRRPLDEDFGAQSNFASAQCRYRWRMRIDVDERFPMSLLAALRPLVSSIERDRPRVCVVGFPRRNYLDGKLCNDLPDTVRFSPQFYDHPDEPEQIKNLDIQYRLHRGEQRWIGPVHEKLEVVLDGEREQTHVVGEHFFEHRKTRFRQRTQHAKYLSILRGSRYSGN